MNECSSAASYMHRDVPHPHAAGVRDDAERGVPERPGLPLDPLDPARDRPQDVLGQRDRQADRHEVGEQQVLDHVERRELLPEAVDRRDQRDEQQRDPGEPQHEPPTGAARAPPSRRETRQRWT